ncbi:MAG TPA: hypothetical protein VGR47_02985 [Terracidiphilus sp.]|nr:hypothetical protein [Terracidiphilus sp.]
MACRPKKLAGALLKGWSLCLPPTSFSLCVVTLLVVSAMSQEPSGPEATLGLSRSRYSLINPTIAKAKAAGTEKGAEAYAADLTDFVVSDRPGKKYVKKLSRRLASADLAARRGNRGGVSESAVVQAFNDMMSQVSPSPADQIKTEVSVVHQLRYSLYNTSPDLSTVTTNKDKCLPSEAMFVIALLMWNNGNVSRSSPGPLPQEAASKGAVRFSISTGPDARLQLSRYLAASSRPQMVNLYNRLAQTIGF